MEVGTAAAALASRAEEEEEGHFYSWSNAEAKKAAFSRAHGLTPISLFSEKDATKRKGPFSLSVGPAKDKLKGNGSFHRPHRSFEESPAGFFFSDPQPDGASPPSGEGGGAAKIFPSYPREERPISSDFDSVATPVEAWSPATTDRSTPPYDSRLVSPAQQRPNPTPLYDSHLVSPIRHRANPTAIYDSRSLVSPTRLRTNRRVGGDEATTPSALDRGHIGAAAVEMTPIRGTLNGAASSDTVVFAQTLGGGGTGPSDAEDDAPPSEAALGKVLRFFRKRARSAKIGSAESPTSARTPASHTPQNYTPRKAGEEAFSVEIMSPEPLPLEEAISREEIGSREENSREAVLSPGSAAVIPPMSPVLASASARAEPRLTSRGSLEYSPSPSPRAPFGGKLHSRSPSRFFLDGRDNNPAVVEDRYDEEEEEEEERGASAPTATVRPEPEGDLEEGGVSAAVKAGVDGGRGDARTAAVGSVLAEVDIEAATGASTRVVGSIVVENTGMIVLPCAPSDKEKVSYYATGRFFLVLTGTISFCTLTAGMWLFTITSPYFYWFGGPTVFLMVYLIFHYFAVAMWGKDFQPDEHTLVVKAAEDAAYLPTVDVFLPVCNEDIALLNNTWEHVKAMDYPSYTVFVLDDGAKDDVRDLAAEHGFQYIRRDDRPHFKKAGNLRYAFARTSGEAVVIFDADFCPRSDFLRETTPYLLNSTIGILQTPQFFRWREEQTWVEQGAGSCQEFFYRMVQMNQDRFNGSVCVGSCGLYRRAAVEPFGGVAAISHSEDMYTGFKMTEIGYKIKYLPLCLAMGTCPDEPRSFFMQQYRWCMGSATLVLEDGFWSANISKLHKICFINGLLYYVATALILFMAPIPIILLIYIKADGVLWFHSAFAVPSIVMGMVIVPLWASQPYGMACHRVRVIQCYAHLYALKDRLLGTIAVWVPSGGGASSSSSKAYVSSVWLMVTWTTLCTVLIVGGSLWRMMEFPWYHYVPAITLAFGSFYLNMSTLWY